MTRGNAWDSENNIALTRLLIKAGGKENKEFSHPMHQLPAKVREEVQQVTHLNNKEKNEKLSEKNVGWEDILRKAEELHRNMTVKGSDRWPPQCNVNDLKALPNQHGAHLTQCKFGNNGNSENGEKGCSKHENENNGQHEKQSFKKKGDNSEKGSWKTERPTKSNCKLEKQVNGMQVHS